MQRDKVHVLRREPIWTTDFTETTDKEQEEKAENSTQSGKDTDDRTRVRGNYSGCCVCLASVFSLRQVSRKTRPTPVQMALSARLKAGKPISPPPRCLT